MNNINLKTGHNKEKTQPGPLFDAKELILRSCIILCCLALSSCFYSVEEYPKDWPPVKVAETECPDLTGDYEDYSHVLGKSFIGGNDVYRHIFGWPQVSIAGPENGKLHVTVYTGYTLDSERTYVQDEDFKCQEGHLEFLPSRIEKEGNDIEVDLPGGASMMFGCAGGAIFGGIGKDSIYWVKAEDGSLLKRSEGGGVGGGCYGCIPLPMAGYGEGWQKFEQFHKPIEQNRKNDGVKDSEK